MISCYLLCVCDIAVPTHRRVNILLQSSEASFPFASVETNSSKRRWNCLGFASLISVYERSAHLTHLETDVEADLHTCTCSCRPLVSCQHHETRCSRMCPTSLLPRIQHSWSWLCWTDHCQTARIIETFHMIGITFASLHAMAQRLLSLSA